MVCCRCRCSIYYFTVFDIVRNSAYCFFSCVDVVIDFGPIAGRFLQTKTVKTNVDSLIGDYATVTARIHNQEGFGKAVIRGQEWTAAAEKDDEIIEAGSRVVVTGIRGVKLIVAKIEPSRTAQENS